MIKELKNKVDSLLDEAQKLKKKIEEMGQKPAHNTGIDWGKMPKGTLVIANNGLKYVFSHAVDSKTVFVYEHGRCHLTSPGATKQIKSPKLAENQPWQPWFGGGCPVDPNVRVDYVMRNFNEGTLRPMSNNAGRVRWEWLVKYRAYDIIAWRISDEQETIQ